MQAKVSYISVIEYPSDLEEELPQQEELYKRVGVFTAIAGSTIRRGRPIKGPQRVPREGYRV